MTTFIFLYGVTATGTGKTVLASSLAYLLKTYGLSVVPIKFDGILNINFETMMSSREEKEIIWRGEEVFITKDGKMVDSDIGVYERFLDQDLSHNNNLVNGSFYYHLLKKEERGEFRKGEFLNLNKDIIPLYVSKIKDLSKGHDVCFIELGGTYWDEELIPFSKALRAIKSEGNKCISICYSFLSQKSNHNIIEEEEPFLLKTVKHSYERACQSNLPPDFLFIRSDNPISLKHKERISRDSFIPKDRIIRVPSVKDIYDIPSTLLNDGELEKFLAYVGCKGKRKKGHIEKYSEIPINEESNVFIMGDIESSGNFISLKEAIRHSLRELNKNAVIRVFSSEEIEKINFKGLSPEYIVLSEVSASTQKRIASIFNCPVIIVKGEIHERKFSKLNSLSEYRSRPTKPTMLGFFKNV